MIGWYWLIRTLEKNMALITSKPMDKSSYTFQMCTEYDSTGAQVTASGEASTVISIFTFHAA